jgi:hypothetical protein
MRRELSSCLTLPDLPPLYAFEKLDAGAPASMHASMQTRQQQHRGTSTMQPTLHACMSPLTLPRCCCCSCCCLRRRCYLGGLGHDERRRGRLPALLHELQVLLGARVSLVRVLAHELLLGERVDPNLRRSAASGSPGGQLRLASLKPLLGDGRKARDLQRAAHARGRRRNATEKATKEAAAGAGTKLPSSPSALHDVCLRDGGRCMREVMGSPCA